MGVRRLLLILLLSSLAAALQQTRIQGPSRDFRAHHVVRPRVYHGRSKREITSTKESNTEHADTLSVGMVLNGVPIILDLRLNTDLIPHGYKERYQHQGSFKTHIPREVELCHYHGGIRDMPGSWAAVSTCEGLKGSIFDGENLHHIQPEEKSLQALHYVYKHSDLISNATCGYKGTAHNIADEFATAKEVNRLSRHKRAATGEIIRGPYNANRQSRYVELVLVIDKNEYTTLGENLTRVHHHCKDIANIINALYTPLNIFIALVGVEVWTDTDEIHLLSNGDMTLNNFLQYRRERLVKNIPNDNAQLLTKMQFDEGVVGKALKGPICTYEFSGGVSVDHSNVVGVVAATVAHEMGHNFGMEHDTSSCVCPEDRCIMAPSSGSSGPTHWSSCSLEYLALAFEHGMDYCLRNKPKRLFDSPICGNGYVEPGEQCDCGLVEKCDNPCCDASSCMLHANASCATGECCDLNTCKPKRAGTECRSAEQECDLPEYCTGQSEYCPTDVFKIDGEVCSMGQAYCYQGSCRTHSDQCKLLWGPTGSSSDDLCYEMNSKGSKNGNCGFNRTGNHYIKCHDQNKFCGMLHCKHLNERLEFGMESVATLSHSFLNSEGKIIACRSAIVDLGLNQVDPGLAPDGARCGQGKMCVNQKCMPVAELRTLFPGGKACPNDCSGNGVCNSLGHCHCNRGYRPPDCIEPGVGGSEDSGPAEDPNARSEYIMGLYIVFLGIVPTTALISMGVWYSRNNGAGMKQWAKSSSGNPISTLTRNFGYHHHHHSSGQQPRSCNGSLPIVKTIERNGGSHHPLGIDCIDSSIAAAQQDPLLPKCDADERFNNNFFGQFKGFSITPLSRAAQPTSEQPAPAVTRPAPPPPAATWNNLEPAIVPIKTNVLPSQRTATLPRKPAPAEPPAEPLPPLLPPPNAGSTARPLISSPVLAATTCTNLELKLPTRPAPEVPAATVTASSPTPPERPSSASPDASLRPSAPASSAGSNSTLTRIASMLYPGGKPEAATGPSRYSANSLPRSSHQLKAGKLLDKELLRSLEISHPIPQREIEIPVPAIPVKPDPAATSPPSKRPAGVSRAQSMRDPKPGARPAIHSFGSMRGPKRPTSVAASVRPTSPPPGPPSSKPSTLEPLARPDKIPGLPGYQNPQPLKPRAAQPSAAGPARGDTYEDCNNLVAGGDPNLGKIAEESPSSNDNIYAVIEESVPEKRQQPVKRSTGASDNEYKTPRSSALPVLTLVASGSDVVDGDGKGSRTSSGSESMGLLGEIVSEISNRNFDSIYSTKKLSPKREKPASNIGDSSGDASAAAHYKSPSSVCSTTSSGYLHPSAVNPPEVAPEPALETKSPEPSSAKPKSTPAAKPAAAPAAVAAEKKKEEPKTGTSKPSFGRTKSPAGPSKQKQPATSASSSSSGTSRQNSDSSLKSSKSESSKNNSPDVVSSCSSGQSGQSKSPDVLGGKPRASTATKTSSVARPKNASMPPKPSGLLAKAASFSEKKDNGTSPTKETKGTGLQKTTTTTMTTAAGGGKSNVASLQQKFEQSEKSTTASGTLGRKKPQTTTAAKK